MGRDRHESSGHARKQRCCIRRVWPTGSAPCAPLQAGARAVTVARSGQRDDLPLTAPAKVYVPVRLGMDTGQALVVGPGARRGPPASRAHWRTGSALVHTKESYLNRRDALRRPTRPARSLRCDALPPSQQLGGTNATVLRAHRQLRAFAVRGYLSTSTVLDQRATSGMSARRLSRLRSPTFRSWR